MDWFYKDVDVVQKIDSFTQKRKLFQMRNSAISSVKEGTEAPYDTMYMHIIVISLTKLSSQIPEEIQM